MADLEDFKDSVAILVSSCDAFFDTWRPFVHFFRKFWPDCPFPIFLIVNDLSLRSDFVRPLAVGPDREWASNMKRALEKISEPRILYFQEDYFLNRPIRPEQLAADFRYAIDHEVDAFCFRARSELESGFESINERFGVVPKESDGRTRCQLTLWKKDSLRAALREGETAWEMEARGSGRTRDLQVLSYRARENTPVSYLMSAIVRGLWMPEAITMCAQDSLRIHPRFRGMYSSQPLLRRFRRALTRKALERELARHRGKIIDLDHDAALES